MESKKETQLIYKKITNIMSAIDPIAKDKTNKMQGYKFRGIDDMYNALHDHLAKEEVFVTSNIVKSNREERPSKNGGVLIYSILEMVFRFYTTDGSFVESVTIGEAMDSGDKSMNKAMSIAYKYALMQIFCIPTEELKTMNVENNTYEVAQKSETKKVMVDEEQAKLLVEASKAFPKDLFIKSLQDQIKKTGSLSAKQVAALQSKLDQANLKNNNTKIEAEARKTEKDLDDRMNEAMIIDPDKLPF